MPKVHALMLELKITNKVTFTGFVKNDELHRYLNSAHILLHTALFETGCAVIQEAMASGVVVVGTDVGILADIGDEYAVIVPPGEALKLAEKTLHLVHDPVLYQEISKAAYRWITTYNAVWSYKNYKAFIEEVRRKDSREGRR